MAKKKKNKKKKPRRLEDDFEEYESRISPETKKSVLGVILLGLAIILILASFHAAGPAGNFIYGFLDKLLGVGYFLVPITSLVVGVLFLLSREKQFFSIVFFGMIFFILAGLGLIDVLLPGKSGFIGSLVGSLETPFGAGAAIILLITLLITALLLTLNASIKFRLPAFFGGIKKDEESEELTDKDLIISGDEQTSEDNIEEEKETEEEKELDIKEPVISPNINLGKKKKVEIKDYVAPPLSLLRSSIDKPMPGDLRANANIIKRTLESFGIPVEMGEINIGPKVTRYTLKPAEGVKLAKILALGQDLALSLAAHPIRIEAPIPGKSLVGIEVPNKQASIVRLGSLLSLSDLNDNSNGSLIFPMGRDVSGEPILSNIEKLPHLLVAGSTGSGKSILVHAMIISLLYRNSPQMLKMILIDPKRVELSIYEGIPHLISPVITEGKKSVAVFRWALSEMDRRYDILLNAGARDIKGFNKDNKDEPMPYLIIVIDELADLMAAYGREIEGYIVRLAQMARATGIHLVLATQRPSVEVVTGLIKANITGRIALQVASQIDSRTILDTGGAEKLLGGGDLLFISSDFSKPKRIQGGFITEEEIKSVVKFIRDNNETLDPTEASEESQALANSMKEAPGQDEASSPGGGNIFDDYMGTNEDEDDLLPEAVKLVKEAKKASASLLQRRLKVGYARAARLLDIMEDKGLIGPADGAKPREVYLSQEENEI
jgi:S-DNA-T family DNA segregation ATPase FtsK/SpoIIIE